MKKNSLNFFNQKINFGGHPFIKKSFDNLIFNNVYIIHRVNRIKIII